MRLTEADLQLKDIDLGGFDAESDLRLAEYFVETPYVGTAVDGRRTLFLGRKGSGKSALFSQLPRLIHQAETITLTPDQYAWSALKRYQELGLLPEAAHTNAWKLTLAIEIAGHLASLDVTWSKNAAASKKVLADFVASNFGETTPGLTKTATGLLKGLGAFNLSAFGFGVGFEKATVKDQPLTPAVVGALTEAIRPMLAERPVVVALDRLDDSWDGSDDARSLLVGLLKASKQLNDDFRSGADAQDPLRVLVFLRSDIYGGLRFDDKDKHRPTEEIITWTHEGLTEMLNQRLPEGVTADEIFEEGEMRGRITPVTYILKRTFLRPREVLQFVDGCIRQASPLMTEISKSHIRQAEKAYSTWKVDDLKQEFARVSPRFSDLIEALRQELHRYDSIDDLTELLRRKARTAVDELGERRALETLFDASVVGVRLGGGGSTRFKAEEPELSLPASGAVYVHQSLYQGLNIREARKTDSPSEEDKLIASENQPSG